MGYSARYHAASLAAVFLALAVGILIGVGLGDNVVSRHRGEPARQPRGRHRGRPRRGRRAPRPSSTGSGPSRLARLSGAGRRHACTDRQDRRDRVRGACPATSRRRHRGGARADRRRAGRGRRGADAARRRGLASALGPQVRGDRGRPGPARGARASGSGPSSRSGRRARSTRCANVLFIRSSGEGGPLDGVVLVAGRAGRARARRPGERRTRSSPGWSRASPTSGVPAVAVERSDAAESVGPASSPPFEVRDRGQRRPHLGPGRAGLRACSGAEGSFGIKETRQQPAARAARALGQPTAGLDGAGSRSPVSLRGRAGRGPGGRPGAERRRAGPRELRRRASSPSRSARCWSRPRWWRSRRWRRSTTAPTSTCSTRAAALVRLRGRGRVPGADRRLARPRRRAPARRGAGAATRGRCSRAISRPGAIKAVGAFALAAYATSGLGRESLDYLVDLALLLLATNMANLLDLRPGRVEKALALVGARALPRLLDARADRAARPLHRPGRRSAPGSRCASGRCSATRART